VVVAKRNADITVTVNKDGYEPQVIPLTKEIPGAGAAGFAGNLLAGGLVGMGVDAATGAAGILDFPYPIFGNKITFARS
jgi:hypothetical protein